MFACVDSQGISYGRWSVLTAWGNYSLSDVTMEDIIIFYPINPIRPIFRMNIHFVCVSANQSPRDANHYAFCVIITIYLHIWAYPIGSIFWCEPIPLGSFFVQDYPIGSIFWHEPIPLGPFFGTSLSRWVHFLARAYPVGSIFWHEPIPLGPIFSLAWSVPGQILGEYPPPGPPPTTWSSSLIEFFWWYNLQG